MVWPGCVREILRHIWLSAPHDPHRENAEYPFQTQERCYIDARSLPRHIVIAWGIQTPSQTADKHLARFTWSLASSKAAEIPMRLHSRIQAANAE